MAGIRTGRTRLVAGAVATAEATGAAQPTVIPEHGAFAGTSSRHGVISCPRADGHPVIAAANPLPGPASDAAALRAVLDHVNGPKILVGHSHGDNVIGEATAGVPARQHPHTTEVAASHSVAVSHSHLTADVIERAARATVR
ncbi:hypothetical protein ACYF6T_29610 [Streptomyces sp. 7R007]